MGCYNYFTRRGGGMADAQVSKTCNGNIMRVRPPPPAQILHTITQNTHQPNSKDVE